MRGNYVLILQVERPFQAYVGTLGKNRFKSGFYLYVGSALGCGSSSLEGRLNRHLRRLKRIHWHIDHLTTTPYVKVVSAYYVETDVRRECELTDTLVEEFSGRVEPSGFGSTDCGCDGHLIYIGGRWTVNQIVEKINVLKPHGLRPYIKA